nr:T9SS type A sorting domain-containing protein [Bacteroidota bacterium]
VTDAFTAQYFASPYSNTTSMAVSPTPVLNNVSIVEYWTCDRTTGSSNVPVKLYWENGTRSGIGNYSTDLVVARWNGSAWENAGQSAITASTPGDVTSNSVSSFSPFTFGSRVGSNPLPIELLSFEAIPKNNYVELKWITATETNNDFFTVERSKDASDFISIAVVKGSGNSTKILQYKTIDSNPLPGISYYRLKQTDFDGNISYSSIKTINFSVAQFDFNIFPNPSATGDATIELKGKEGCEVVLKLYDAQGKELYSRIELIKQTGDTQISLNQFSKLSSGVYFVVASSNNILIKKKLIIK